MRINLVVKYLLIFALMVCFFEKTAKAIEIDRKKLADLISTQNFIVLENAQITYQSREAVAFARDNLLPQLNLWDYVGLTYSWSSVLGIVSDVAPFLVPANWFRWKQQKILFLAQKQGYHALWANQLLNGHSLYLRLEHDLKMLAVMEQNIQLLTELEEIVRVREIFGQANIGDAAVIELKKLDLLEDKKRLEYLIKEELGQLKYIAGIDSDEELSIAMLDPDIDQAPELQYEDLIEKALSDSPEIKQFNELIRVIPHIKREVRFSFLGTSSISRGVAGGVFDDIPVQRGLGFGAGNTIAILRSKAEILKLQRKGVEETIKNQLRLHVQLYNADKAFLQELEYKLRLAELRLDSVRERLLLGERVDVWSLADAVSSLAASQLQLNSLKSRFLENAGRINRILMQEEYAQLPDYENLLQQSELP